MLDGLTRKIPIPTTGRAVTWKDRRQDWRLNGLWLYALVLAAVDFVGATLSVAHIMAQISVIDIARPYRQPV